MSEEPHDHAGDAVPPTRRESASAVAGRTGRRFLVLWGVAFAVATFVGLLFALQQVAQIGQDLPRSLVAQLIPWYSWAFLTPFVVETVLWLRPAFRPRCVALTVVAAVGFIAVHLAIIVGPTRALGYLPGLALGEAYVRLAVVRGASDIVIAGLIIAVVHAVLHARRARAEELERAVATRQALEARLDALRIQLHPHFLLNTLNRISALAAAGEKDATEQAIIETGDLLREALRRPDVVTVVRELDYLRLYLRIMSLGRANGVPVRIDAEPGSEDCLVPSFVLQPLVENALRHGRADPSGAKVEVTTRRDGDAVELTVRNPAAAGADPASWSSGIGIRNTRSRLDALYGDAATLAIRGDDGWVEVRVRLPARPPPGGPAAAESS